MVRDRSARPVRFGPAWKHVTTGVAIGIVVAAGVAVAWPGVRPFAALLGWDVGVFAYVFWIWLTLAWTDKDHTRTAEMVTRDDPSRPIIELILLVAGVASLVAVLFVIVRAGHSSGAEKVALTALGMTSVVASWLVVQTTYTLRYAKLYYTGDNAGIDFNQTHNPQFTDFAYLAFTIGMTFQVSDTDIQTSDIRSTALRHGLLSYVYGTVIIATAINLVAGLAK